MRNIGYKSYMTPLRMGAVACRIRSGEISYVPHCHRDATIRHGRRPPFAQCRPIRTAAMGKDDCREYHRRAAARLRSLAEYSTTKAIKARLIARPNSLQANTSGLLCLHGGRGLQAGFAFAGAIIITAIMASSSGVYAQAGHSAVPNADTSSCLRPQWSGPVCAIRGNRMREIPISVGIASKRINLRRFRALRRASLSARAANAYGNIGSGLRHSPIGEVHLISAIWLLTW
jgi:hypothetical protein